LNISTESTLQLLYGSIQKKSRKITILPYLAWPITTIFVVSPIFSTQKFFGHRVSTGWFARGPIGYALLRGVELGDLDAMKVELNGIFLGSYGRLKFKILNGDFLWDLNVDENRDFSPPNMGI
jgi:hypothetical protein